MSGFFGGHADASGEVVPEATGWAYGQDFASATPDHLRHCENLGLEAIDASELDFATSHKRAIRRDGTNFRFFRGDPMDAEDAASAYCVVNGFLILLALPGQGGRLQSERLGSLPVGRALRPDDRVLPQAGR